jgi:hypothetical protein
MGRFDMLASVNVNSDEVNGDRDEDQLEDYVSKIPRVPHTTRTTSEQKVEVNDSQPNATSNKDDIHQSSMSLG